MNKKLSIAPLSMLLLAVAGALPAAAQARDSDDERRVNYWAVQGGVNRLASWPGVVNFGGPSADASLTLDRGATFGVVLGRQYGKARYDLEYQHGRMDITGVRIAALAEKVDSSLRYDTLTINATRQLRLSQNWLVYGGIGAGYGRVNLPTIGLASGCKCITTASRGSGVVQLRAGLDYQLNPDGLLYLQLGMARLPGAASKSVPSVTYPKRDVATLSLGYRGFFN